MFEMPTHVTLASAAVLAMALSQTLVPITALAADSGAPEVPSAQTAAPAEPVPTEPAATPAPVMTGRAKAEDRRAAMDAERAKRYVELRASAAELGVELPETPPWESARAAGPSLPEPPDYPSRLGGTPEDMEAMRQQRESMRAARWERMREEAAARGIEMPDTPPWEEAGKRRQEMAERFQNYRRAIEQMTDEQREAARALFGGRRAMPWEGAPRMHHYGYEGWDHPCQGEAQGMPYPPMRPHVYDAPGYDQGPPPPPAGSSGR
ncbi:hypothetical protein [Thiocystis violacea]|uniref:hypothetical protein n=1 Tax=Thiocystis violacea TaxID=13725 RepID=UPI001907A590|nr:hypothetical protein [Thiocystis violacea]MBK1716513.1 hypothetical protein [Thiocystis violacea]